MTSRRQLWVLEPLGAQVAASRTVRSRSSGIGSGRKRRIERVVDRPSSRPIVSVISAPPRPELGRRDCLIPGAGREQVALDQLDLVDSERRYIVEVERGELDRAGATARPAEGDVGDQSLQVEGEVVT